MAQFRSAKTQNDLISATTVVATAGQYQWLGSYQIMSGELLSIGFGSQSGQNDAQGRFFCSIMDNTASPGVAINGTVRLTVYTPQKRPLMILGEWRTETLSTGSGDRTKQVPLPESIYQLSEDKYLALEFMPDATATVGKANTKIVVDTTEWQA